MMLEGEIWTQKQNGKYENFFTTDWGGFSSVAQSVQTQIMESYMFPMLWKAGWCIGTTYRKTE